MTVMGMERGWGRANGDAVEIERLQ